MTTEIEKTFFETFGIKPKKGCTAYDKFTEEEADVICNDKCAECSYLDDVYPKITDHILLELLCLLADLYDSNSHGYPLLSKNIKELKEDVLDDLMGAIDVENDYPEGYTNKVRALFKEYNNDR